MSTLPVRRQPRSLFPEFSEATYEKGILTVSVNVSESKPAEKHVPIASVK